MANTYFRFKEFIIHQDKSSMKVCTDSCVFGAWTALRINDARSVLDIGTGTGLLSLMIAQQSTASIDAVELDPASAEQAAGNIALSTWKERIRVLQADIRGHLFESTYDFIITNPPFYESDLHSADHKKNSSKHDSSLTLSELLTAIETALAPTGRFSILLPYHRAMYFENLCAEKGFFLSEKLILKQTPAHAPFRVIYLYERGKPEQEIHSELVIKDNGKYTEGFAELLGKYYLNC